MKTLKILTYAFLVTSIFIFTSCLDNEVSEAAEEAIVLQIENEINTSFISENVSVNAEALVNAFITSTNANGIQKSASSPKVSKISQDDKFPIKYEIHYEEFYNSDGNVYNGKVVLTKKSYKESEILYNDFYCNKKLVQGYRKVNAEKSGVLYITAEESVDNSASRYIERTRTLIDNNNTVNDYTDDSYEFTGITKGTTIIRGKETEYNSIIVKPLVKISGWKYFVKGTTHLRINARTTGTPTLITDYGDGDLDNIATRIKTNGKSYEIYLKW